MKSPKSWKGLSSWKGPRSWKGIAAWWRGGLSWTHLARRVASQVMDDDVVGIAAQLAYYFLFSLFPLLLVLTTVLGYFADDAVIRQKIFSFLADLVPKEAALELLQSTLEEVVSGRGGGKLSFGLLATLWAASAGMAALIRGLNAAFDVAEDRPWWSNRLRALGFVLLLGLQLGVGLTLIFYGSSLGEQLAQWLGLGAYFAPVWAVTSWLVVLVLLTVTFDLLYNLGPNLESYRWRWMTPGAVVGVWLWLAVSLGFRTYLNFFDSYSRTYGSLGTVIILLLWFYLTGIAVLMGAETNSEIYKAERGRSSSESPE
ncbi:MAG: YihY/virulence factor BrkB family protein [Acidobacteriota bacterium]|nr:YihY/virulence factor BrkB family protein [Acidobacteriota bacterium]